MRAVRVEVMRASLRPFRAAELSWTKDPGRCPGLADRGAFSAAQSALMTLRLPANVESRGTGFSLCLRFLPHQGRSASGTGVPPVRNFESSTYIPALHQRPCLLTVAQQIYARREAERWT